MKFSLEQIWNIIYPGVLWMWAWILKYLHYLHKWHEPSLKLFLIHAISTFILWMILWEIIPSSIPSIRWWTVALSWFLFWNLFSVLEARGDKIAKKLVDKAESIIKK